jgi:integrase
MPTLAEFLEDLKPATKYAYQSGIFAILDSVYGIQRKNGRVSEVEKVEYEKLSQQFIAKTPDEITKALINYAAKNQDKPPKSVSGYVTAMKEFVAANDIELSIKNQKELKKKMPKGSARTIEADLDHEKIRVLLSHADIKMKAIILLAASSGMRQGELMQLEMDDIDLSNKIGKIKIRAEYTKGNEQRITYCSKEAAAALREWYKVRDRYIENKPNGIESKRDFTNKIFPFTAENARISFENILKKAQLFNQDRNTQRSDIHLHMFRKFFSSQLRVGVPIDRVECLMGHEGYLSDAYRRYSQKQIQDFYERNERLVTVQLPKEIQEIEREFTYKVQGHSEILEDIVRKNIAMEKKIDDLTAENQELKKEIDTRVKGLESMLTVFQARIVELGITPEILEKNILRERKEESARHRDGKTRVPSE